MKRVVEKLNLRKALETEATRERLKMAGFRGQAPVMAFLFFRATLPLLGFGLCSSICSSSTSTISRRLVRLGLSIGGAYFGFYLPNIFISNLIQRRQKSIKRVFPDSLDLLLICVQAGMSVESAMNKVAGEIGPARSSWPRSSASPRPSCLICRSGAKPMRISASAPAYRSVRAVGTSLIQAERYGTAIGQALRVLAKESRDMRMAEAEKKAAALPPKLTVPMIVFFLPVLFIVILGPAFIQIMASAAH